MMIIKLKEAGGNYMLKRKSTNTIEWVIQFKTIDSINKSIVNKALKVAIDRSKATLKELRIGGCKFRLTESLAGSYLSLSLTAESCTVSKVLKSNEMKLVEFASELVKNIQQSTNFTLEHCRMSLEIMSDNDLSIIEQSYSKDQKRMLNKLEPFFDELRKLDKMSAEFVKSLNCNEMLYNNDRISLFNSRVDARYDAFQDYTSAKLENSLFLKYDSSSKSKELHLKIVRNNLLYLVPTCEEDRAVKVIKDYVDIFDNIQVIDTHSSISLVYTSDINFDKLEVKSK